MARGVPGTFPRRLGSPEDVDFFSFFVRSIQALVPGFSVPADPPPLPFHLRDKALFRQALLDAGLSEVRIDSITKPMEFQSGEHLWS